MSEVCDVRGCGQPSVALLANDAPLTSPNYREWQACRWHRRNTSLPLAALAPMRSPFSSCCVNVGTEACACADPHGMHHGMCPKCGEFKFIGHGPLCIDCFEQRATEDQP